MTVIAWDGVSLAADKRACNNGLIRTVTKISRLSNGWLFGASGTFGVAMLMREWVENGMLPEKFPELQKGDQWSRCIVINEKGYMVFEQSHIPMIFENEQYATGSGRDHALTAMHLGRTAAEAVQIACLFDSDCGNGVDVLTL